jgi:type II secretory pathway pseudopilin PulG
VKHNKKAFTMIEMLVCLVCVGFLAIGIGTFAATINAHSIYISAREDQMLHEYQDVLNLKANGSDAQDNLNFSSNLYASITQSEGATFNANDYLAVESNQLVKYSSSDESVLHVDENGNAQTLLPGIVYIKANILTLGNDGEYHDTNNVKYIPIIVISNTYNNEFNTLNYYYYGGQYYSCWVYVE